LIFKNVYARINLVIYGKVAPEWVERT